MNILLFVLIIFSNYIMAMNPPSSSDELTPTEKSCYAWFVELQKQLPSTIQKLSAEDAEVFNKQLRYAEHPEVVTRSRHNCAEIFYASVLEAHLRPEYEKDVLKQTFVKMAKIMDAKSIQQPTDLLSARMYVFSQLLTSQERSTYSMENYLKNPQLAHEVAHKWSQLVCVELVKLHLLEDTEKAREQKIQELYAEQLERFKKQYTVNK